MGTASWYQDFANGYQWSYRAAITVDVGSNTGARDVSISIPATWDYFWETVRSAGQDVRITAADGVTLIPFDIDTFSATNRTGTIEIDNYTVPGTGSRVYLLWIYWGQASCSTAITPLSISGADTGYIELGRPSTRLVSNPIQRPGTPSPANARARAPRRASSCGSTAGRSSGRAGSPTPTASTMRLCPTPP